MLYVLSLLSLLLFACTSGGGDGCHDDTDLSGTWQAHYEDQGPQPDHPACAPQRDGQVTLDRDGLFVLSSCDAPQTMISVNECAHTLDQKCGPAGGSREYQGTFRIISEGRIEEDLSVLESTSAGTCVSTYKVTLTR